MADASATSQATTPKRYRVHLIEQLHDCVDVLPQSEDEAREIATETEMKGEPDILSFDVEEVDVLIEADKDFSPVNACVKCGGRIEGDQRLNCEMTLRAGKIVYDLNGRAGVPWRGAHLPYPTR